METSESRSKVYQRHVETGAANKDKYMEQSGLIAVTGNYSFKVQLQPEYDHFSAPISLRLRAFTHSNEPLSVLCTWKRSYGQRTYRINSIQNK